MDGYKLGKDDGSSTIWRSTSKVAVNTVEARTFEEISSDWNVTATIPRAVVTIDLAGSRKKSPFRTDRTLRKLLLDACAMADT